jgi:hypothetical protein
MVGTPDLSVNKMTLGTAGASLSQVSTLDEVTSTTLFYK